MGLDMYAYRVKQEHALGDFEIAKDENDYSHVEEFYYWRKHHDLHGWMERLYRSKGGPQETFNCTLPETQGFFFGTNPPDAESLDRDLKFIQAARDILAEGDVVYYDSWW